MVHHRFITLVVIVVDTPFAQADCNPNSGVEGQIESTGGGLLVDDVHGWDYIGKARRVLALAQEELCRVVEDLVGQGNHDKQIPGR